MYKNHRFDNFVMPLLLSVIMTTVSLAITGFQFGVNNNIFHIPYVLNLQNSPAFGHDAFYHTLKYFTSAVWPLVRIVATPDNIEVVFAVCHFLSRLGAFLALVFLLRVNGVKDIRSTALALLVFAVTPWTRNASMVGEHGLFLEYFTHSEVTWAFVFLTIWFLQTQKTTISAAMIGITFCINAFIGIWMAFIGGVAALVSRQPITLPILVKGVMTFLAIAAPVIIWVAMTLKAAPVANEFSYIEYTRLYYPNHFLIEAASVKALAVTALLFSCGILSAAYINFTRFWIGLQFGSLCLFLIGIFLPYIWDNRFVFNLHLLRSDGIQYMVSSLLVIIAAIFMLGIKNDARLNFLGYIILASMTATSLADKGIGLLSVNAGLFVALLYKFCIQDAVLPSKVVSLVTRFFNLLVIGAGMLFVLTLAYNVYKDSLTALSAARYGVVILGLCAFMPYIKISLCSRRTLCLSCLVISVLLSAGYYMDKRIGDESALAEKNKSFVEIAEWVKDSSLEGTFLVPVRKGHFQLLARRPVWVDFKQGAAVMWDPSFEGQWSTRYKEVSELKSPEDQVLYAQKNAIPYVLLEGEAAECAHGAILVKKLNDYAICKIAAP